MRSLIWIAILLLPLASCVRQTLPDPTVIESEYAARGTIGGMDTEFVVGENNFYLDPSVAYTSFGLVEYVSTFRKDNGDPTAFEIVLRHDGFTLPIEVPSISAAEVLAGVSSMAFQTEPTNVDSLTLNFCSFADPDVYEYYWDINGSIYTEPTPVHSFSTGEESLLARLWLTNTDTGCEDSLIQVCQVFDPTHTYTDYYYRPFSWDVTSVENQVVFKLDDPEGEIAAVEWEAQDGSQSVSESEFSFTHTFSSAGPHLVSITVTMENGHEFKYAEKIRTDGSGDCSIDMHYLTPPVGVPQYSTARVNYVTDQGVKYSSLVNGAEVQATDLEILSNEVQILELPTGETATLVKLEVSFSCTLYNVDNPLDSLIVEDFTGTIAVAVPDPAN